jgi:ATP-dependent helicase HrpB
VVAALQAGPALVIEAPPGAGKTTRVPAALLDGGLAGGGEILVLQPRRLPARLAAERVAEERGEAPGATVGYTIRFDDVSGPGTRLRFLTEGILVRRLLADPTLRGVAAVVLDEFHERHLATDLSLGLLRALQRGPRPDLRLLVMSATLDADPVRAFLDDCPLVRSEGRAFPIEIEHLPQPDDRPPHEQVAGAVRRLCQEGLDGDVLVFLPGAGEIRRAAEALGPVVQGRGLVVRPLHGDLPPGEQNHAIRRSAERKVILSTNVAETSVTIEGVVAVIDVGLARIAGHSVWSGLPTLTVEKISQASAIQRAGRAGRTRPGRALRLYTRHDFEGRRPFEIPEVARLDLAEAALALHALGVADPTRFDWFEPPPTGALAAADDLLRRLGAITAGGALTEVGRQLLRFPVHPRLGRLVVEGERRAVGPAAATVAALLSEGDIAPRTRFAGPRGDDGAGADLLERLDRFEQARAARFAPDRLRGLGVDVRAAQAVERARRQLERAVSRRPGGPTGAAADDALALATLTAFPDRVMRRRAPGATEAVLASGGVAEVAALPPEELLVAVDIEERGTAGARRGPAAVKVRLAVGIQPEWLLDLAGDALTSSEQLVWNERTRRVEQLTRLSYGAVVLEETRRPAPPSAEATRLLVDGALASGWGGEGEGDQLAALGVRLDLLRGAGLLPPGEIPLPDAAGLRAALEAVCEGRVAMAELGDADPRTLWLARLPAAVTQLLRSETPERLRLAGGREVPVNYEAGKPPWIESRLQDFFGASAGPALCRGRVPLTLHLLAPNGRAVQVTSDLAGFWRQHYPAIRRELSRRYPRHAWPEDGATASPPVRGRR